MVIKYKGAVSTLLINFYANLFDLSKLHFFNVIYLCGSLSTP